MAKNFSMKDRLFNAETLGQLGREYEAGLPDLDGQSFSQKALSGVAERSLMECLDWFADCIEPHLADDFLEMADQIRAMMPPPLDPALKDDDFGQFIHAVPGVLAVRYGLEDHREVALDLLHAATQRFSMEFYIRPFLNRWPDETLARLERWATDENYHVRRLVSEGTRPNLPWARGVDLTLAQTLPLLDLLHADDARFVTRSVANHLNDVTKKDPEAVLDRLVAWQGLERQTKKELDWMTRHALRTLVKDGHPAALLQLGYRGDIGVKANIEIAKNVLKIGETLSFECELVVDEDLPVLVDYRLRFARPGRKSGEKVFKLKQANAKSGKAIRLTKDHKLKGDATTFRLYPGPHEITLQVNGVDRATSTFELIEP